MILALCLAILFVYDGKQHVQNQADQRKRGKGRRDIGAFLLNVGKHGKNIRRRKGEHQNDRAGMQNAAEDQFIAQKNDRDTTKFTQKQDCVRIL